MAGYLGPNNRRYEKHYKWWLRVSTVTATVGAVVLLLLLSMIGKKR